MKKQWKKELTKELKENNNLHLLKNKFFVDNVNKIMDNLLTFTNYLVSMEYCNDKSIVFIMIEKDIENNIRDTYEIHYAFYWEWDCDIEHKNILFKIYDCASCLGIGWDNIEGSFKRIKEIVED